MNEAKPRDDDSVEASNDSVDLDLDLSEADAATDLHTQPTGGSSDAAGDASNPMVSTSRGIRPHGTDASLALAAAAAKVALDNKGQNVIVLNVCKQSAEFDFFVLATGSSRRQLHAISEEIDDVLQKELGDRRLGIEGYEESRWIVLDYGSVVIHLFDDETREYYDLESLWADGKEIPLESLGLKANPE